MKSHWPSGRKKLWSAGSRASPFGAQAFVSSAPTVEHRAQSHGHRKAANTILSKEVLPARALKPGERGLIISCDMRVSEHGFELINAELDPQDLRMSLLFWDQLDWPKNNFIGFVPGGLDFLTSEGVLTRTSINYEGPISSALFLAEGQMDALNAREEQSPGQWALAQGTNSISVADALAPQSARGLWFELARAIPVPSADVPYSDILEFRARRRDELHALRFALDALYQDIIAAPDRPLAEQSAFGRIHLAAEELRRVTSDGGLPAVWTSLRSRFSGDFAADDILKPIIEKTIEGGLVALFTGSYLSAVGAGLSIGVGKALLRRPALGHTQGLPLEYAYHYHKDLPWIRDA